MAKPRIVLADIDIDYIIPLQAKFINDFFGKIDLEIITDESYFNELFSTPQRIDILVVSENLYGMDLQRHPIANTFVLKEEYEEEATAALNVTYIFKYTSLIEIFNEIAGKSGDVLNVKVNEKKEPQILLVYSACGGVGKSTIAFGISAALTKQYKRVLYINAGHLQTFQRMLENPSSIASNDVYKRISELDSNVYRDIKHVIRREAFSYLPPFKASLMSLGLTYKIYKNLAISAKLSGEYDYIVIDGDSVFDEDKAALIDSADKVLIVTTQAVNSVYATDILVSNINGANTDKYLYICNNYRKERSNALTSGNKCKFSVNEYVNHIENYDHISCDELAKDSGVQKVAFLVL